MKFTQIKKMSDVGSKMISLATGLIITNSFVKLGSFLPEALVFISISYVTYYALTFKIKKDENL